jgi:hypothetical protein
MIGRGLFVPFRDRHRQVQKPVQFARTGRLNFNVAHCQAQRAPRSTLQPGAGRRGERGPGDRRVRDHEFPNEAVTPIRTVGREGDRAYLATLGAGEAIELPQLGLCQMSNDTKSSEKCIKVGHFSVFATPRQRIYLKINALEKLT